MRTSRCAPNQVRGARGYREVSNSSNFVKMILGLNESSAKLSHQLKMHMMGVM